jgi:hypothetical protein
MDRYTAGRDIHEDKHSTEDLPVASVPYHLHEIAGHLFSHGNSIKYLQIIKENLEGQETEQRQRKKEGKQIH